MHLSIFLTKTCPSLYEYFPGTFSTCQSWFNCQSLGHSFESLYSSKQSQLDYDIQFSDLHIWPNLSTETVKTCLILDNN